MGSTVYRGVLSEGWTRMGSTVYRGVLSEGWTRMGSTVYRGVLSEGWSGYIALDNQDKNQVIIAMKYFWSPFLCMYVISLLLII